MPLLRRLTAHGLLLLAATLLFDLLIAVRPILPRLWWAAMDPFMHGALAWILVVPLLSKFAEERIRITVAAVLPATLLDLDHFIAAGSWDVAAAVALTCRPPSHSLATALLGGLLVGLAARSRALALCAGLGLAAHVLRDATGGCTPLLWPLRSMEEVPYLLYLSALIAMGCGMVLFARRQLEP